MVRHGDSPKIDVHERTRGLTEKGRLDAVRVADMMQDKEIDILVSNPYTRSILTLRDLASHLGQDIMAVEDLKERVFSLSEQPMTHNELIPFLQDSFDDWTYSRNGGESNRDCQVRAVHAFKLILKTYKGKNIAIGTHGVVMTLIMNHFDSNYDYNFVFKTTKPDIYKMEFREEQLMCIERIWVDRNGGFR